jgi:lipopolysaccharide transport system permease protein
MRFPLQSDLLTLGRNRDLLLKLTRREIEARFRGSALGVIWLYAQPLALIAAYYLLFDVVFGARVGAGAESRSLGLHLIAGIVPWMAFADAVSRGMHSLVQEGRLLQKTPLPPVLFPARAVLASAVTYLPLLVMLAAGYAWHLGGSTALLLLPALGLGIFILAFLAAYSLALLTAAARDVEQVAGLLLALGLFASPVLFPIERFPDSLQGLLWLNPMTPLVLGFQSVLLDQAWPHISVWLAVALWAVALALLLGRLVANSHDQLVDWL